MPLMETERGALWVADTRQPGKIPLLLVHGAGASHLDFPAHLRRYTQGTLVPDLSGHGKSPGDGHASVTEYAADLIALLDALSIEKCIVVGHSMGGAIAQTLALTYSERIAGLIIVASGAKLTVNDAILNGIINKPDQTAALITKWAWAKGTPADVLQRAQARLLETDPQITQRDYIACNHFDVREKLSQIAVPTLVIGGTADKMTPLKWSETLAEQIPDATLEIIDGGGHMLALEQAARVTTVIHEWLKATFSAE